MTSDPVALDHLFLHGLKAKTKALVAAVAIQWLQAARAFPRERPHVL
jgi:hypothetical protein